MGTLENSITEYRLETENCTVQPEKFKYQKI